MTETALLREDRRGPIAILTMNAPKRRNALSMAMRRLMIGALDRLESDRDIRAIVVTGEGGTFSAGGDISDMDATDLAAGRDRFRISHRLVGAMIHNAKPIIAAVEGWCVGAGMSVALCCDTIVAAADARFMASFGRIGLIADLGLPHTLPRRVGEGRARQILLYGETFGAEQAERIGLIDHVVAPGTALEAALARAALFADAAPLPVALTKAFLARGLDEALALERDYQSALFGTADHAEGKAAFLGKRKPAFTGT